MLKNYYKNIVIYNFLLKNKVKNIFCLIQIKQINISFKNKNLDKKKIINIFLFLKLFSNQKLKIKKNKINIKIKKEDIINIKINVKKKNFFSFLEKILLFNNNNEIKINKKNIIIKINNVFNFLEFKNEYYKFKNIIPIKVNIYFNNNKNLKLLLNYFFI